MIQRLKLPMERLSGRPSIFLDSSSGAEVLIGDLEKHDIMFIDEQVIKYMTQARFARTKHINKYDRTRARD